MANKKKKKQEIADPFSKKTIYQKRKFPVKNTVLLIGVVCIQVFLILFAFFGISVSPKDIINDYEITVIPQNDGTLKMTYNITWTAMDKNEELSWVDIGMPNSSFTVDDASLSDNILTCSPVLENSYVALRLYFKDSYSGGEKLNFSFSVNQRNMLCKNDNGYFYEFIPGWFNSIPVEHYSVRWAATEGLDTERYLVGTDGYVLWQGSLGCGEFVNVFVNYNTTAFDKSASVSAYIPFDSSGVYNQLKADADAYRFLMLVFSGLLVLLEIHIIDCYVSFVRGRGFIRTHGHYVHIYGIENPVHKQIGMRNLKTSSWHRHHSGGGTGSGCACACACACAGGGRAGCSQKDTYEISRNFFVKNS